MGRMAILKIIVAGVLIFVVFSALMRGDDPDLSPSLEFERSGDQLLLRDPISAVDRASLGESDYLFLMTKFGDDRVEPADLRIVRADDGVDLEEVGWIHTSMSVETPPSAIAVSGDYVYVGLAGEDRERPALWVVDVSNPEDPFEANLIGVDMPIRGLATTGDGYLIASGYDVDFKVFDISVPNEPEPAHSFSESISVAPRIEIQESLLLVDHMAGVVLVDVSDSLSPERVGEVEHPDWVVPGIAPQAGGFLTGEERFEDALPEGNFLDVAVDGDLLTVATGDRGLLLVDLSDPASPKEMAEVEFDGRAARVAVSGGRAWVLGAQPHSGSDLLYNIYTLDVSDPSSPRVLETSGDISGVPRYQRLIAGDGHVLLLFNDAVLRFETAG